MAEGVLFNIAEGMIKQLGSLAAQEVALWWGVKEQLRKLMDTVTRIKAVLQDAEDQALKQNDQIKDWLGKLREAVYDAEDLLDDFSTEAARKQLMSGNRVSREVRIFFSGSNQYVYGWRMGHKVKDLRERLNEIDADNKQFNFEVRDEERASLIMCREQTTSAEPEIIIGREADKEAVIRFLLNSNYEENVSVISIVGIGGLGKTALAQHVFNDEQVKGHFALKLWVCVSSGLDIKKILKRAVGSIGDSDQLESLKTDLETKIEERKYLLVLDDVWDDKDGQDGEKWDCLKQLLPRSARGSKIIITTRSNTIANFTSNISPHLLEGLSEKESWSLFEKKAFRPGEASVNLDEKIKREIVDRCGGVPLVIKAIGRLMSQKDKSQWLSFIVNELPYRVKDDNIIQTLKLSYDPLPSHMKHCFAYCRLFPKGEEIDVESLILLWIAQGFIQPSKSDECLEIAGLRCFENLAWRSFFHEVKRDDLGSLKSCRMHCFMHDLAATVAGFESSKTDQEENNISDLTRHVSIDIELDLSPQNSIPLLSAKSLRTLIFLRGGQLEWNEGAWKLICRGFKRLRVLDLHGLGILEVSPLIRKLKQLKYLDLSKNEMETLPNSISNLLNLQVLKLNGCVKLKALPGDINKLVNLGHIDLGCLSNNDVCESLEYMPRRFGQLTSLRTLSYFVVGAKDSSKSKHIGGLDELSRFDALRGHLEIRVMGYERSSCITEFRKSKLREKQYLQSLFINWHLSDDTGDVDIDLCYEMLQSLQPHSNLQVLGVRGYGGMSIPSWILHLTSLKTIYISECENCKRIPPLDGIPSLENLGIYGMSNLEYIDSEGAGRRRKSMFFPSLQNLEIMSCPNLKGWWKKSDDDRSTTIERTPAVEEEDPLLYFPCLSVLHIRLCRNLTSMPLFPSLDDKLQLRKTSSAPLQQTLKMTTWKSPSAASSSPFVRPLSKLKHLNLVDIGDLESLPIEDLSFLQGMQIWNCGRLESLPLSQGMHSLLHIDIQKCRQLRSLSTSQSQGIPCLPTLQFLQIRLCNEELSGRLRGKEAVDWPNITHIPNIIIDDYDIQRDGRCVYGTKTESSEWEKGIIQSAPPPSDVCLSVNSDL